jgi:hypothetical protein
MPRAGRIFFVLSDFRDLRDEHEQLAWQGKQHRDCGSALVC